MNQYEAMGNLLYNDHIDSLTGFYADPDHTSSEIFRLLEMNRKD